MSEHAELRERGGARLGHTGNWTWPFATLCANQSEIEVRTPGQRFLVKRDHVHSLRIGWALFSKGLEIEHSVPQVPAPLIFWTMNATRLESGLTALGYAVVHGKLSIWL